MEHRQNGYAGICGLAVAVSVGVGVNCSLDRYDQLGTCRDLNYNNVCDINEGSGGGVAGSGGTTTSSGGTGGIVATGGGGSGGTILVGGGGAGGGPPVGGSGGTGGQGGGPNPVVCGPDQVPIPTTGLVVCWYLDAGHHPPNTTLGLGGLIKEPGSPIVAQSPFPGCTTSNPAVNTLVCPFGSLATGTDFTFDPYATDGATTFWRCDQKGFPTSKCFGEYWVFVDGVEVAYFIDPPTGRWSYDTAGAYLRLVYTDPG